MTTSPIAEEAAKLVEALQDWVGGHSGASPLATGGAECCVCPICQLLTVVRTVRPDVLEHLSAAAVELFAALRSMVDASSGSGGGGGRHVEHIDVGD